ncbi:MAG: M48 family metalloprotease, partial [Acidobacteria bacterium]|nr:M48 family metalloprotease [Acidobacteriota bacterium]
MFVKHKMCVLGSVLTMSLSLAAADVPAVPSKQAQPSTDAISASIFDQETKLVESMRKYTPLIETYIQNTKQDRELGDVPFNDQYFLGRLALDKEGFNDMPFEKKKIGRFSQVLNRLDMSSDVNYLPRSFMQLLFLGGGFDKNDCELRYRRQEFVGSVRTLVFDVAPTKKSRKVHFVGRIWVEDQGHNIVRFNGTYEPLGAANLYFHFDSWRMNMQPGLWLPAFVYMEEGDMKSDFVRHVSMKGQMRLWGYTLAQAERPSDFTDVQVDSVDNVSDKSGDSANEISPLESRHKWQREAEDNVLERMERAGLLAPDGEVSKVLETVANNIEATNNVDIQPEVRCRVLLTTPLESFTVGHTVVISRGLLDVLPDEASLAMVISHELAHIVLGHSVNTKYAFSDRMIFPDEQVLQKIAMRRSDSDEDAA